MEGSGQNQSFVTLRMIPHCTWLGWVDPRVDLSAVEKRKIYCLRSKSKIDFPQNYWVFGLFPLSGILDNIVTCQPIVGLPYRALLGSRPVNNTLRNNRGSGGFSAPCVATQQAAMTSHGTTLVSEATPL
jgi:hypothetical protein